MFHRIVRCAAVCSLVGMAACNSGPVDQPTAEEVAEELKDDPAFVAQLKGDKGDRGARAQITQAEPGARSSKELTSNHRVATRQPIGGDEVLIDLEDLVIPEAPDGITSAVGPDEPFYPLFRLIGGVGCAGSNDCYERLIDPGTGGTSGSDARNILPLESGVLVGGRALFTNFTTCDITYTVSVLNNGVWVDTNLSIFFEAGQGGLTTFTGGPVVLDDYALVSYHVTQEAGPCTGTTFTSNMSLKYQH